jgi:hypothetical protein
MEFSAEKVSKNRSQEILRKIPQKITFRGKDAEKIGPGNEIYEQKLFFSSFASATPNSPELPDGLFSNQNPNFGYILDGLEIESVSIL